MRIKRIKNAKRNIVFGMLLKIYQIVLPFIMRTLMIYQMGLEYAGLNNLFTSIFQVLNLAELGVGAALTFSMYEPIAKDDSVRICALLKVYRFCFRIIGVLILMMGLICMPFLKFLIKGSVPDNLNIYILFALYLINTVLSYWLFSYKKSLIYAHQRIDINSKIVLTTSTIQYILQMYVLLVIRNYYLYLLASIFAQILSNLISALIVNRIYPYRPIGTLDKKKVQGLVTNKLGGTILRSADSIVISAFLGLNVLAIYQNYYFILTAVISLIAVTFEACIAGIGNSLVLEESHKNYEDFCTMTFMVCWLIGLCCSCFLCLYQPFITLWVGEENLLAYPLVICLVVYFFVYEIDQLIGTFKDAAGIWYQDRYRPLVTAIVNLILSIILVQFTNLYGVLISTVISLVFIGMPWLLYNVFKTVFIGESINRYLTLLLKFVVGTLIVCFITYFICERIYLVGFKGILVKALLTIILSNILNFLLYFKCKEFSMAKKIVIRMLHKD